MEVDVVKEALAMLEQPAATGSPGAQPGLFEVPGQPGHQPQYICLRACVVLG
jgi:hypothetical protein